MGFNALLMKTDVDDLKNSDTFKNIRFNPSSASCNQKTFSQVHFEMCIKIVRLRQNITCYVKIGPACSITQSQTLTKISFVVLKTTGTEILH